MDYVDLMTEPGVDKVLSGGPSEVVAAIRRKANFSLELRQTGVIAVVGHHDCLAHPVSREQHWEDIQESVRIMHSWGHAVRTLGLWVNEWGSVDLVCDTQNRHSAPRHY